MNTSPWLTCFKGSRPTPALRRKLLLTGLIAAVAMLYSPLTASALTTSPATLTFSSPQGNAGSVSQAITFWKGGDRSRNWTAAASASWASVTPASGTISGERDQVAVSINPTGLSAGTYTATVSISMETLKGRWNKTSIPVTLTVSGSTASPSIRLSPLSLGFAGVAGGVNPAAQSFNLANPTGGTLSWSLSDNAAWLSLSTGSGTTTTETDSISASVNLAGLAAGTYSAAITVTASGTTNSPQVIPVSLTVAAAPTAPPAIRLSLASLTYTGTAGGTNPANQSFTISNAGGGTLTWSAGDTAAWLTLSPATGTNTGTVTAAVNLNGLTAGTYSGTITVTATEATSKTLPVSLTISPGQATSSSATLNWNANTETDLAGYKIYVGTQSGTYGAPIVLGIANTYQITNLTIGTTYFFSITAYDKAGNESPHSAETSKSIY